MKKLLPALLIVWLGAGVTVTYLWAQLDRLRNENAVLLARVTALEAPVPVSGVISPQVARAETPVLPAIATPPFPAERATSSPDDTDFRRSMMRATLAQLYPDLDKVLGLTSEELDKFEDLLTRQSASPTFGRSPADQADLATLLGDKYPQWQAYQESLPGRQQVVQIRGQLAASGSALPDAQAQLLMAALNAEFKRAEQEMRSHPLPTPSSAQDARDRDLQRAVDYNNRLVTAAAPFLNQQQLDSYRQMLDRQLQRGRVMMDVMSTVRSQTGTHK